MDKVDKENLSRLKGADRDDYLMQSMFSDTCTHQAKINKLFDVLIIGVVSVVAIGAIIGAVILVV